MATVADFTARARDEMYSILLAYIAQQQRIQAIADEVEANGGAVGLYGAGGVDFPSQGDGFTFADMAAAFVNLTALIGVPSHEQMLTLWKCRR